MPQNPCTFFKVRLNSSGEPIPGTMMSFSNNKVEDPCEWARVLPYQVPVHRECRPQSRNRYFYLYNKVTRTIVPNSMFSGTHKPQNMCMSGSQNSVLEFIVTQPS